MTSILTGLMDAGVGSIIVATAFACGMNSSATSSGARTRSSRTEGRARRETIRLIILTTLGVSRTIITWALGYHQHVGEYGVHWNFFLTLAAVRALTLFVPSAAAGSSVTAGILGLGVLAGHQGFLSAGGLTEIIHSEERGSDYLSANKEGIFSLPGYFALHLLGCACGAAVEEIAGPSSQVRWGQQRKVLALIAAIWTTFWAVNSWIEPVSRRACNAAYILWMLGLNAQSLALLSMATGALPTQPLPPLLQAVNDTMLPTFLIANVLTGAVNIVIDTMKVNNWIARIIVVVYMMIVCIAAAVFQWLSSSEKRQSFGRRTRL